MLVGIRHPVGIGVSALALLSFLAFVLSSVYGEAGGAGGRDPKVERIRADSAPLIASDLAGFQERRRRAGRGYAPDTEALVGDWLTQFGAEHRRQMREWTRYHGVRASATRHGFAIETLSVPGADGWYRLEVDRRARRVAATCGGDPAPGCVDGRWAIAAFGQVRGYLLGR
jgi:hypothetical protein